jgi:hypothetical protein
VGHGHRPGPAPPSIIRMMVNAVVFSLDGKYLLVGSGYEALFYLLRPADLIEAASDPLPANLTVEQWARYIPDVPYRKSCPNRP